MCECFTLPLQAIKAKTDLNETVDLPSRRALAVRAEMPCFPELPL
jgi:hypothetical protein